MLAELASLISVLEESQAQNEVPADLLLQHLQPVQRAIDADAVLEPVTLQKLISVLCSWLRAHEDSPENKCTSVILKLLPKLLGQDQNNEKIAVQKGLLSSTTALLQSHMGDAHMVKCCLELLAMLSVVESSDQILSRLGAVPLTVDLLQKHRDNTGVLEDVITTLALLAKRTRHRRALTQSRGITMLVDVLKRYCNNPRLVVAVCRFLSNFAVKEDCCIKVLHDGGVDALMAAFNNSVPQGPPPAGALSPTDARAAVAAAIWTCSSDCTAVQTALLSSGWLSSLAAVLEATPDHAGLHEAALGIVRGLSRSKQYREDIVNLGFITATIHAMDRFWDNTVLLKEACGVFGNLAQDPDIRVQLGEIGVIQEVLKTLAKCRAYDDRKVAKLALGTLTNLASSDSNRDVMAKSDAASVLLDAARIFMRNENILEYAIGAISHLAVHEQGSQQLVRAGAIEALLLYLSEHREDLEVVSKSLVALRRLNKCTTEKVTQQIACAGHMNDAHGVYLLVEAFQAHIYDGTIVRETALLLTSISKNSEFMPALMSLAVHPCMKALEVHQNDTAVADALAGLLSNMPLEEDEGWDQEGPSMLGESELMGGSYELMGGGYGRPCARGGPLGPGTVALDAS